MSKPEPIQFKLHSWSIEYESQYFESDRTGMFHFMAHVRWTADIGEDKKSLKTPLTRSIQKMFTSFELAKEWVDKEVS